MSPVASASKPSNENGAVAPRALCVSNPAHAPSSLSSASTPGDDDLVSEVSADASDFAVAHRDGAKRVGIDVGAEGTDSRQQAYGDPHLDERGRREETAVLLGHEGQVEQGGGAPGE